MNTKQITQLDRAVCKDITNELNTALASLGEKLGVSIRTNGAMLKDPKGKFFYLRGYKQRSYKRPFIIVDAITNQEYVAPKSTVLKFTLAN